ncbi:MAG: methylmalonyl Co-A mutase-associated GTPase MeaB [Bryobacteraceae bacterium]
MAKRAPQCDLAAADFLRDQRALARAATLIESQTDGGRELVASLFPKTGRATLVGITGPPGAGKSTLVNQLIGRLRAKGGKVGVLAVDPSSPYTNGAILGDRIRLAKHYGDPGVFIRSMATRGKLGGLARGTLEVSLLLDAAGFDTILIETVGVGQDEVEIAGVADVTVVVLVPGFGDDVQAIKAGIMEIADVLAINKADLPGADRLEEELRSMQSLSFTSRPVPIVRVIASQGSGVELLLEQVDAIAKRRKSHGDETEIWSARLREMLRESLLAGLSSSELRKHAALVASREQDPYEAVRQLKMAVLADEAQS